ncbi:VOC family protein [Paracoccus alkanivorans]|uniref:VOC family protein n=1 Tax=Paracoccus alkanivorans TaxID=2116655 RepID=A0A3M0MAN3_9RHOB|nr:VOC family protein [Paracoccus alkanivorans]RMC34848.1 VOC family protein [Paracoccus alkanivorans]
MITAVPQLMFQGALADAVALWSRAFPDMTIEELSGEGEPRRVLATVAGQKLFLFDSPVSHEFTFTPAISLVITCDQAEDVDRLAGILGEGGQVFMPLDAYPFSPRFTWVADRFGVSWQLMQRPEGSA